MTFGRKWAEEVHHPMWAAIAAITDKIGWLTGYKIREIRQFDDYAWRRATEVKNG